ncbi:MAG: ProQ/FINO family protein, partial [Candidatus Poseidoniaceae archaeon]|nr:ProQ/FINO family protein [Candidatus Poseidoniaceae archaeon]
FRTRKEDEVATQLERQLDKREEIMRNKALIEVRKREAGIRAEIEAQLGVKRTEIRDRLSTLTQQMDDFRTMAESKMRESIEGKVQGQIDAESARLAEQESEYAELQTQGGRVEKRQDWLKAISGQGTQSARPQMGMDPTALGARPDALGATGGRQLRGALAQAAAQHKPSIGLGGMRAPTSTAKTLSGTVPIPKPIKAPLGGGLNKPASAGVVLPQPTHHKVVRQPVLPKPIQVEPVVEPISEQITEPIPEPEPTIEEIVEESDDIEEMMDDAFEESIEEEISEEKAPVLMTPIKSLEIASDPSVTQLTPVDATVLTPTKRRGPPPSSARGQKPGQPKMATLSPVKKLNPVRQPTTTLKVVSTEEEE